MIDNPLPTAQPARWPRPEEFLTAPERFISVEHLCGVEAALDPSTVNKHEAVYPASPVHVVWCGERGVVVDGNRRVAAALRRGSEKVHCKVVK